MSAIRRQLHTCLMRLPTRFTREFLALYGSGGEGYDMCIQYPSMPIATGYMSVLQMNAMLDILLMCGASVKCVAIHGDIESSTDHLLQKLRDREKQDENKVLSLLDLSAARIRTQLPVPCPDEVLKRSGLPKALEEMVTREKQLTDILASIS